MDLYKNRVRQYKTESLRLAGLLKNISTLRLIVFLFSLIIILVLANERSVYALLIAVPVCVITFCIILQRYQKLSLQKKHLDYLTEINENEILRQENHLSDFPAGQTFLNRDHPYLADFDIFGQHSLFQLLNRTTTESGQELLAKWLSEPAPNDVISERQKAIRDLTPRLDWRLDFQASGMPFINSKSNYHKLLTWAAKPSKLLRNQYKLIITGILLTILSLSSAVWYVHNTFYNPAFNWYHIIPFAICIIVNRIFLGKIKPVAEEIIEDTQINIRTLGGYQALITKIEAEEFNTEMLSQLQSAFTKRNDPASHEVSRLKKILEMFQTKGSKGSSIGRNDFYAIFNTFLFFDVYLILLTEKWKFRNGPFLDAWASAVSAFEVLNSLAGFSYANPDFTFPEISTQPCIINFEKLGHPLIIRQKRVCNDFSMNGMGEIALITGSNMAGKSTFLRSVGVNLVLALMGAPCCAASAKVSPMKIFTSMRTQDNLEEGISSFYAELKRIEQLLKIIGNGEAVFFLLDEMFKGTNSQDRFIGGVSLIRQLSDLNASGIISTHDIELARMTTDQSKVTNFSFNSEIAQEKIIFNYTLTEGICTDFNASALMKKSGIKILSDPGR